MPSCPNCGQRLSTGRTLSCVGENILAFVIFLVLCCVYLGVAFGFGIGAGCALGAMTGLDFDVHGVPWTAWMLAGILDCLALVGGSIFLISRCTKIRKKYKGMACLVLTRKLIYDSKRAFCSKSCFEEWTKKIDKQAQETVAERAKIELERKEQEEEERRQRVLAFEDSQQQRPHVVDTHEADVPLNSYGVPVVDIPAPPPPGFSPVGGGFAHQPVSVVPPPAAPVPPSDFSVPPPSDFSVPPPVPAPAPGLVSYGMHSQPTGKDAKCDASAPSAPSLRGGLGAPPPFFGAAAAAAPIDASGSVCCICLENRNNVLYYPCKHCSQCSECPLPIKGSGRCPICRTVVEDWDTIFVT